MAKPLKNVRKRVHVRLVCDQRKARKLIPKPQFMSRVIYSENLVPLYVLSKFVKLDKAVYFGSSILGLSKFVMYQFDDDSMKRFYSKNIKVAYVDTDSFVYHIKCANFYQDMKRKKVIDHFDTSGYPQPNQ